MSSAIVNDIITKIRLHKNIDTKQNMSDNMSKI